MDHICDTTREVEDMTYLQAGFLKVLIKSSKVSTVFLQREQEACQMKSVQRKMD